MTDPTPEQRADLEDFLDEQLDDLPLAPAEDARLRDRIRRLAFGEANATAARQPAADVAA